MQSIDIFPWNKNFNTGIAIIDEQHEKLVDILNTLASHVAYESNISELSEIFDVLTDYAAYHFKTEELIWHEFLPEDEMELKHLDSHLSFIATIEKLKSGESVKPLDNIIEETLSFLTRWLVSHILETDRQMAIIVQELKSGISLDVAKNHAIEKMSGTMRVLIDIILSTYGNHVTNTLRLIKEIAERKKFEATINDLAFYDPLTHLPNLNLLISKLETSIKAAPNLQQFSAILTINIDDFKSLNDFKGREVGDLLLIEITDHLKSSVQSTDIIARVGGDEFVVATVLLSDTIDLAISESRVIANRILARINQPLDLRGHDYHCTVSIGITLFNTDLLTAQQLLKQANVAMHHSRRQGRNSVCFFDPVTEIELESRVKLESWMHKALIGQYRLYYQIQVDAEGKATGAEALIRWHHPEKGMIFPAEFIPIAEETGLIIPIGNWVLKTACFQLKAWQNDPKFKHLVIAVNVSAKQFRQPDFATQVLAELDLTGADADKLKLEITESLFVENVDDLIGKMNVLKSRGVKFSLDDFGTGFSSLSILKRLPLNQLKIDQSFVRNILNDPSDAAIIRTVIALGQSFGLEVIAEGVETVEQRNFLAIYGCHFFQGYLYSKPLPLDEFEALIRLSDQAV
jgi:diguanylate cyclase (GGDEF)-like protein/hemerythrin-like metal-binding protein